MEKSELRAADRWTSFASRVHLVPEEPVVSDETLVLDVRPSPSQEVEVKLAYLLRYTGVPASYVQSQVMVGNRFANQSFSRPWELTDPAVSDSTDPLETRNIETPDLPVVFAAPVSNGSQAIAQGRPWVAGEHALLVGAVSGGKPSQGP